jgi:4-amino-4-deoxy-L-arabinose transferase-like glycosyltransferase
MPRLDLRAPEGDAVAAGLGPVAPPPAATRRSRLRAVPRPHPALAALVLLACALNLWALDQNGLANAYYAGAVRSMSESWHAFLYGAFDAAGVMTVDKPPLALWVQALSARVFGFSSLSILVPQALMGVAAVALTYDLTRRRFGVPAGLVAGLVLALTPVSVAMSRHNNPDALLVLCSVGALWALVRGLEDGRTRWLVLCGVCVGLGFEAKMAAALMVVPGIAAAWLWVAPRGRPAAVRGLLAGGAALAAVALAWPLLVALTPAEDRPWVSGTSDNSVWSLILGYNGLGRLLGQDGGPRGAAGGPGGGGAGGVFGGDAGALRLLNESLGGQAGWLLGFALVAGLALVVATRLRRADARTGWAIAVGGAFLTTAIAFSFASGIFHPYYVSLLAPFTAALVGGGAAVLASRLPAARVLAPLAVAGGVATELVVLGHAEALGWLVPVLVVAGAGGAAVLVVAASRRTRWLALGAVLAALLVGPAVWSGETLAFATSATFPAGGPASASAPGPGGAARPFPGGRDGAAGARDGRRAFGPPAGAPGLGVPPAGGQVLPAVPGGGNGGLDGPSRGGGAVFGGPGGGSLTEAVAYARAHGGGTVAVSGQAGVGTLVAQGADVAAIGGFSGRESQVSVTWLADAIDAGKVSWVVVDGDGGMPDDGRTGAREVLVAVEQVGVAVEEVDGLYDVRGAADALRALGG